MIPRALLLLALSIGALPSSARAQGTQASQDLEPAEAEAYQMSLEMAFVCNPSRHRTLTTISSSSISREGGGLAGTAAYLRSAEGTFLVLEGYDESMAGHCLVLAWFGGELEPGAYRIRRLGMGVMEEEASADQHSFFSLAAVRSPDESSVLVTEAGSLELSALQDGTVRGQFQLSGFVLEGSARRDAVTWEGSFTALERDP